MKKTIPALLLILLLLTGCGGSAPKNNAAMDMSAPSYGASSSMTGSAAGGYYDGGNGSGWETAPEMPKEESSTVTDSATSNSAAVQSSKMIYTADLNLQTKEFDTANAALTALVEEMGGYFEMREIRQGGTYRSLYCTIRVPAEQFTAFLDRSGNIANVTYRNESADNVSEVYYDLEARLTTQRTKLHRLQELLAKAENMEDIITIESAISETELQIEYLTGSLRNYDSLISFSTVRVSLDEVYRLSTEEETPMTFGDRLASAFKRGFERGVSDLEDFIISLARNWMTLIIWAGIITVVVVVIRRRRKVAPLFPKIKKKENVTESENQDGE